MVCDVNFSLPGQPENVFVNGTVYCWDWTSGRSYWLNEQDYTCREFDQGSCWCPQLKADPDIAGIGVILAYLITAGLTLLATFACLLLSRTDGPRGPDGAWQIKSQTLNAVDVVFRKRLCRTVVSWLEQRNWDTDVLAACAFDLVQSLSDTQVVTGIAVLVAGMIGLTREDSAKPMTVYHFTIVTDLAWFSSNTHLLSLLVLRSRGISSKETRRRSWAVRLPIALRVGLMLVLACLLLYATWITGFECWYYELRCPAKCTTKYPKCGEPRTWMIVNFVLILYSYPLHMIELSLTTRRLWLRHRDRFFGEPNEGHPRAIQDVVSFAQAVIFWPWNVLASELFATLELIVWFVLGCYWIFQDRQLGHDEMTAEESSAEDKLGFGQLVPIVLLLLPLLGLTESYAEHAEEKKSENDCHCDGCEWHAGS